MIPQPIQTIIDNMAKKGRKPFVLVVPDGRTFMAMTFDELLRVTSAEFHPMLALPVREMRDERGGK
jgi:hypothetical protein